MKTLAAFAAALSLFTIAAAHAAVSPHALPSGAETSTIFLTPPPPPTGSGPAPSWYCEQEARDPTRC